jgi:hypothetical protein
MQNTLVGIIDEHGLVREVSPLALVQPGERWVPVVQKRQTPGDQPWGVVLPRPELVPSEADHIVCGLSTTR